MKKFIYCIESVLYNTVFRLFLWKKPKYKKRYRISLCGMFKNEGRFLKEWVEYYKMIGVDHLYMYNNNSEDNYLEILQPYIDDEFVTLVDWTKNHAQIEGYKNCFDRFRNETQWLAFIDLDEFLIPRYANDINEWIKDYERYPSILVYWKMFGTGGKMSFDPNQLVIEQFTVCNQEFDFRWGKCIFNTDYNIAYYNQMTHHYTCMKYPVMGMTIRTVPVNVYKQFLVGDYTYSFMECFKKRSIQLNHYWCKSWDLYEEKRQRTDVFFEENPKKNLDYFYINESRSLDSDYSIFRFVMKLKHRLNRKD